MAPKRKKKVRESICEPHPASADTPNLLDSGSTPTGNTRSAEKKRVSTRQDGPIKKLGLKKNKQPPTHENPPS